MFTNGADVGSRGISLFPRDGQPQWNIMLHELGLAGMYLPGLSTWFGQLVTYNADVLRLSHL